MTQTGAYVLAVVCEADADRRAATRLADRVLCREVDWIEPEILDGYRKWQGLVEGSSHLEWHQVWDHAHARGLKAHGYFLNEPGAPDARTARLALLLLATSSHPPHAAVLVRDSDGQRKLGLEQARRERNWPFPVAVGLADSKRECWVLAGFDPRTEAEEADLGQLRQELGFDPRLQPEALSAKKSGALRDAKRVLSLLVGGDFDREESCLADCPLDDLVERGRLNGLADYLEEIRTRLVPLFKGGKA